MFNVAKMLYYKFAGMDLERMEELLKLNPDDKELKERYEIELERNNLHTRRISKLRKIYPHLSDTILQKIEAQLIFSEKERHDPIQTLRLVSQHIHCPVYVVRISNDFNTWDESLLTFIKNYKQGYIPQYNPIKYTGSEGSFEPVPYIDDENSFLVYPRRDGYGEKYMIKKDNKDVLYYDTVKKKYEVGSIYDFIKDWIHQRFEFVGDSPVVETGWDL